MKKSYALFVVLIVLISIFYLDTRVSIETDTIKLQIGLASAEAKVQEWCKSGRKNADEFWQFNWQTGTMVCTCVSEEDDCCVC